MKGYEDDENRPLILSYKHGQPLRGTPTDQLLRYFWGSQLAFFKTLCMSLKLDAVVRVAEEALKDGKVTYNISNTQYQDIPS